MWTVVSDFPWLSFAAAAVLAVLTPLIIIVVRHDIRVRRIRLIDVFSKTFGGSDEDVEAYSGKPQDHCPLNRSPSFEFLKSKYSVDLDYYPKDVDRQKLRDLKLDDPAVEDYINNVRWYRLRSNRRILFASIPYVLLCMFGFYLALAPLAGADGSALRKLVDPVVFTSGGLDAGFDLDRQFEHVATIAAIAFIGAYLYTLRFFIRAVSVFDLSAITFIRAASHVVMTFALVIVVWRALPDPTAPLDWALHKLGGDAPSDELVSVPASWFILALVLGFVPDAGLQFVFSKASAVVNGLKTMDDRFTRDTRSVPLDVIDGIDFFTRCRLEEANVFEVQNLAVANPIMLHIETPYGIYQTTDWVAQAQLCTIVGLERFLMLRQHNIRTIFDLERAVLSRASTSQMRRFVASILLMPTATSRSLIATTQSSPVPIGRSPSDKLTAEEFDAYVTDLFGQSDSVSDPDRTIKHMVRVIVDDLHVQRLRQVWMNIAGRLGAPSLALSDTEKAPHKTEIANIPRISLGAAHGATGGNGATAEVKHPATANGDGRDQQDRSASDDASDPADDSAESSSARIEISAADAELIRLQPGA
jgi:hypothetical protein